MTQKTVPETLVEAILALEVAHKNFQREVEELTALGQAVEAQLKRLVRREPKLAEVDLADKRPVQLPRAVMPREQEGAA
jgi:hypothetical protein